MSAEKGGPPARYSEAYLRAREAANSPDLTIPRPRLFTLSSLNDLSAFTSALRNFPGEHQLMPWRSRDPEKIKEEALMRGILIDHFDLDLRDRARAIRPKGYFDTERKQAVLERYVHLFDRPSHTIVAEYPWKSGEGRFVVYLPEKPYRETIHSRDALIYPEYLQERFNNLTVAIGGMGVGTSLADALVKAGVKNYVVADGGLVQNHDLNRLPGGAGEKVGMNHAIHWAQMAYELDPFLNIRCIPQNLGDGTKGTYPTRKFLNGAGVYLEEMDHLPTKIESRIIAAELGIPVFMATDVEMGSIVDYQPAIPGIRIFPTLSEESRKRVLSGVHMGFEEITDIAVEIVGPDARKWQEAAAKKLGFWPQTRAAAAASEVGIVITIAKWLMDEDIPTRQKFLLAP